MKKKIFYREYAYIFGLIIMAFASAFSEKAGFGMSMVVAPAYILHLKLSAVFSWFSFGVAEYAFQGLLVLLTIIIIRKVKLSYFLSFVTAIIYGTLLDFAMGVVSYLPNDTFFVRAIWYVIGVVACSFAVSLFFHTYLSPEVYELIVKEISSTFKLNINKVKTSYDCISTVLSIVLSFAFFGFGVFRGVGVGTIICALINGFLIGNCSKLLNHFFEFKNALKIDKYFK